MNTNILESILDMLALNALNAITTLFGSSVILVRNTPLDVFNSSLLSMSKYPFITSFFILFDTVSCTLTYALVKIILSRNSINIAIANINTEYFIALSKLPLVA